MQNINFHEIANIFPLIHGKEFVDLKQDIKNNGVHESIVVYENQILDGRNRFRACQEVGVQPEFVNYDGAVPVGYVLSLNLHRRHLNESQRAMVGANIANLENGQHSSANLQSTSAKDAGDKLNVSERSINTAKKVKKTENKELIEMVDRAEIAVSAAAEIANHEPQKQDKIIEKLKSGKAKNTKQAVRQIDQEDRIANTETITNSAINIKMGDCLELVKNMIEKPSLVITDPPYGIETHNTRRGGKDYADGEDYIFGLMDSLCAELAKKCSDDAHLYFFSGYTALHPFKVILEKHFTVQMNPIVWVKDNHTMCDFSKWYPRKHEYIIFCKQKGSERKLNNCVPDVLTFTRERSSTHSAEKPTDLLKLLIEQSSVPGEVVLDPFMGSGSTGVAARDMNRGFVGFELDKEWFDVAESRIA